MKKPFFAKFLEDQGEKAEGEKTEGEDLTVKTDLKAGRRNRTTKYPSDGDEFQTMKYPSDDDEGGIDV